MTYKVLVEKYKEIYYTGDDEAYDLELNKLMGLLDKMIDCLNTALYHGISCQSDQWYAYILNKSIFLFKNKIFTVYYRQVKSS